MATPTAPATTYKTGREWLAACRLYARRNAPCMTAVLLSLVPREIPGLGTMGVTQDAKLVYDPDLRAAWTVKQGATALFHEAWHLLRRHHGRCEQHGIKDPSELVLWNHAGDAEINDDIPDDGRTWEFPKMRVDGGSFSPVFPKSLFRIFGEDGGMPDGQMAEAYWEALRDYAKKQPKRGGGKSGKQGQQQKGGASGSGSGGKNQQGGGQGSGEGDGEGPDGQGSADAKPGDGGWCGSGAGRPLPDEPEADGKGRTQAEIERVRRDVAEAIKADAAKGRGNMPGGWTRWAETQLAPPKIPWQTKLAKIARGAVEWAAGAVDYHYRAPSRRQAGVGFGPGRPVLPALFAPRPEVLCVVDTSGSMGKDELTAGLREIRGVLNRTSARVTFAAADAAVHEVKTVRTWQEILPLLKGGGGTDFRPAFEMASARKPRPQVIIFVTDGDGACPAEAPMGIRTIWLLVGQHRRKPCEWGEQIEMDD